MADYYFDPSNLPTVFGADGSVTLDAGTAIVGLTITNVADSNGAGGGGISATGIQDITLISGATIRSQNDGITFSAAGTSSSPNKLFNSNGFIWSVTSNAVHFAMGGDGTVLNQGSIMGQTGIRMDGAGILEVLNTGLISATGKAIAGGSSSDKIINTGIIRSMGPEGIAIDLGAGDDFYDGSAGAVIGKIALGAGNDKVYGGAGAEVFVAGAGNDFIDGGAGSDTVDYSAATGGIAVDLSLTGPQGIGGGFDANTLLSIENIIGGTGTDWLKGSSADNSLDGGAGNDTLEGGAGNDTLIGGDGIDTVNYYGTVAVKVDLRLNGVSQYTSGYGSDTLKDIENVNGSSNWDTIDGSEGANKLWGGAGNDTINGNGGNDTLEGSDGNDVLDGGANDDLLDGGTGNDSLVGSAGADTLIGDAGNDTLWGGDGNDILTGGDGTDMALFTGSRNDYAISVSTGDETTQYTVTHTIAGGTGGEDTLKDIRLLKFLGANAADASDDVIYALNNSAAPETVKLTLASTWSSLGGVKENTANDTSVGTLSAIDADGDALTYTLLDNPLFKLDADGRTIKVKNKDLLNFETLSNGGISATYTLKVTVSDGLKNIGDGAMVGTATRDVVIKIINDITEAAPVNRYGTSAGEQVIGEFGNDLVHGLGGNDSVFGRSGNDRLYGDDGNDYVIGGDGTEGTSLLSTGNDTLFGGNGNDSLFGGDGNDILSGDNQNDILYGNNGNDVLYGGNGNDTLYGGSGRDTFVFNVKPNTRSNLDFIADFNPTYDTIKLSHAIFTKIPKGTLSSSAFVVGNAFKDSNDRILYLKEQGALFYDPDGSGKAAAIQIANIGKNLHLTAKDFIII